MAEHTGSVGSLDSSSLPFYLLKIIQVYKTVKGKILQLFLFVRHGLIAVSF